MDTEHYIMLLFIGMRVNGKKDIRMVEVRLWSEALIIF